MIIRYIFFNSFYCAKILNFKVLDFLIVCGKTWLTIPIQIGLMKLIKELFVIKGWTSFIVSVCVAGIIGYIACVGLLFVTPETWCEEYDKEISLDNINKYGRYGNGYDEMLWIHGDFSYFFEMAKGYQSAYHLLLNNCAQVTLQVLAKSESAYKKELLAIAARHALPTTIFAEVKSIVTRYSLRYRKSGLRDSIQ